MNVELYRPRANVVFYTENGELVARATNDPKSAMDDDVVSITTTRDMQADSPTFSIELTTRKPWHKWVASNDLVIIQMYRPPEALATVFVGLVDDCRKRVIVADNTVQRVISVVGRGVAKAFIRFDVGIVPEAEYASTSVGWLESAGITLAGSAPGRIVEAIWDIICMKHINYKWSNGKTLFDYVKKSVKDRPNLKLLDSSNIMNWQGSIYALFKEVAEEPFYEVFWEILGGLPTLVVRPTPFNKTDWDNLTVIKITDADVVSDEVGRSDVETYSIFSVGAKTLFSPHDTYKTFGVLPYWNKEYAKKYGNSRLHVETSYTSVSSSEDVELQTDTMRELMRDLYNWNIKNNSMLNGNLVVKGSNKYKVGTRIIYTSTENNSENEFYVTSVTHTFVNFGKYTTTLGVTRGLPPKERFTPPWDKYEEYSGLGIVPFDPKAAKEAMELEGGVGGDGLSGVDFGTSNRVVSGAKEIMEKGINGVKVRYIFGGNDPSRGRLDCSSFTQYVYRTYAGIDIGRVTGEQVTKGFKIDKSQLVPGDLVFFKGTYNSPHIYGVSHVGIYIGDGKFIHNSSGAGGVTTGDLSSSYWVDHWLMGRRVLTGGQSSGGSGETFIASAYGATALNLGAPSWWTPTGKTAIGTRPVEGRTIAVDPKVIPLYSKVRITCDSYPSVNGEYIAEDTGGAIKGKRIDIYFDDLPPKDPHAARKRMLNFGKREVKVTILKRGKG
jgi:cell wall-associated NlpC family hydrolase/3D (Asp-Asp-Asp) domain-containing protein